MKRVCIVLSVFLMSVFLISVINAEESGINVDNHYSIDGQVDFVLNLYDLEGGLIKGEISYIILNYYSDIIKEGVVISGENVNFILPENAIQGPWKLSASYNGVETSELFNVGDYKQIEIKLDGDNFILRNIGNVIYDKNILISIGENDETARVFLEVGQVKKIKLTAPEGIYDVKVSDGNEVKDLVFSSVGLTGNVVGLERVMEGNFFQKFPLVNLFLIALVLAVLVIVGLRFFKKPINVRVVNKSKNKSKK